MRPGRLRWIAAIAATVLGLTAGAEEPSLPEPIVPPPADLEARLRAVEESNRRLLEILQRSDARYRDLERKYDELRTQVGRPGDGPAPAPAAAPRAGEARSDDAALGEHRSGQFGARDEVVRRPRPPSRALTARLEDGFEFRTSDDEYSLHLHVLDQTDFKDFIPNNMFPARSGLYVPRVRVYFEGRLTKPIEYTVSLQRSVDGNWDLLDGFLNFRASDALQLRFGRTLVPYSYDWYDHLEQYFIAPERGLFPLNFGLSRAAGIMAHGDLSEGRIQYAIGGFDGHASGVADNNNVRDAVGYLNLRPFVQSEDYPALRHLNIGGSIFGGQQVTPQGLLPLRTSLQSSENDEGATAASATFLDFNPGVTALGGRYAGALHLAWYVRHLSIEAEWQSGRFQFYKLGHPGFTTVPVQGFHFALGYFLTGETVIDRSTVVPLRPFSLREGRFGLGAVELFARYSQLELGESVFTADLANADESTRQVYMPEVGFNWYLNQFVKFYFDWQLPFYATPVLVNPGTDTFSRSASMFWVRCQLYF
jgi:phosphate-selective porin OprO/OprP